MTGAEFNNFDIYTLYISIYIKIIEKKNTIFQTRCMVVKCGLRMEQFCFTPTTGNNVIRNVPIDLL